MATFWLGVDEIVRRERLEPSIGTVHGHPRHCAQEMFVLEHGIVAAVQVLHVQGPPEEIRQLGSLKPWVANEARTHEDLDRPKLSKDQSEHIHRKLRPVCFHFHGSERESLMGSWGSDEVAEILGCQHFRREGARSRLPYAAWED